MDKNLFGEPLDFDATKRKLIKEDKVQRAWERGFQKWSDEKAQDGLTHYGACGFGVICEYCDGEVKGKPCVRALNSFARTKRKRIDYENTTFEDAFDGRLK